MESYFEMALFSLLHLVEHKVAIEQTIIPGHLDSMLRILLEEEEHAETGATGPCMEFLLQHKILETLYTLARTDVGGNKDT